MDADWPEARKLRKNAPVPPGFPRFLGYHGTSAATARFLIGSTAHDAADPAAVFSPGRMGLGLYISTRRGEAVLFSQQGEGGIANREGAVLRVFCDGILAGSKGRWFNSGDYPERDGGVDVPPDLMGVSFLRDVFDLHWIKINPPFLKHLKFIK